MDYSTLIENAVQNHMAIYGSSRAEAEAAVNGGNRTSQRGPESVDVSIGPEDIDDYFGQPSIAQYDTDVEDPSSPVVEETSTTKLEDGTTVTQKVSNPNNSPKGIAEKQSAEQSNPQDSQAPSDIFDMLGGGGEWYLDPSAVEPRGPSGRSGYTPSNEIDIGMEPPSIFEVSGGPTGRGGVGGLGEATAMPEANVQVSGMGEGTPVSTVQDAENIINDEAPEIIPWINEFEQAVKEFDENEALVAAERITDKAIETGLDKVKPRAFKALTVALTSMLFGVDAVDAIESGAEVVAQDYAEEAAASAAASSAIADQAKFEREELFKTNLKIQEGKAKAGLTGTSDMNKSNYQALKDLATLAQGLPQFGELNVQNIFGELQAAHSEMQATYGNLDLKDSKIGSAYNQAVKGYLDYKAHQPNGVETLNSFMKDKIARKELSKYKSAISSQDLTSDESYESEDSRKFISKIFSRIQQISAATNPDTKQPFGEKEAMKKVKAAFNEHMKTQSGSEDAKTAKGMGVTPFVWFAANWTG